MPNTCIIVAKNDFSLNDYETLRNLMYINACKFVIKANKVHSQLLHRLAAPGQYYIFHLKQRSTLRPTDQNDNYCPLRTVAGKGNLKAS